MDDTLERVVRYHERTKHHYDRYARSPGYMDWANQPDPFRIFGGIERTPLPLLSSDPAAGHMQLFTRGDIPKQGIDLGSVAGFLELSMGLSAWKAVGRNRWALRMNPSSGNLHPTETYLLLPAMDGLKPGVFHYQPLLHALEHRAEVADEWWEDAIRHMGTDGFFVGLTSIFWRESWKYGERAFRYCNLDVGHAMAALSFSAALFGWGVTWLKGLSDRQMESIFGLNRTPWHPEEAEHPDLLCFLHPAGERTIPVDLPDKARDELAHLTHGGTPNRLSTQPLKWDAIADVSRCTRKPETKTPHPDFGSIEPFLAAPAPVSAAEIIRSRRSATAYDPNGRMEKEAFFSLLDKTLKRPQHPPFDLSPDVPRVHLLLFVHRVDQIAPGLLWLFRNKHDRNEIRRMTRNEFLWEPVTDQLPLYYLDKADYRYRAIELSCHQEIAGDSAFSLGMVANFKKTLRKGPHRYRHLYWECGMIGQVLYLEAEAHGYRGTGIGCFFDDPVHETLGLVDNTYQSLYHFTVGTPVEDARLTTHPPYLHLKGERR